MKRKTVAHVRGCSLVATVLALAFALWSADSAHARCELRTNCPAENSNCWTCISPISNFVGSESSQSIFPQTGRSTGSDMGADELNRKYPNMSHAPRPPGPRRQSRQGETADQAAQNWYDVQTFEEEAQATRVDVGRVLDRVQPPRVGGLMRVPMPQGVDRDIDLTGIPQFPGDKGAHNDPIDPITGELLVEHNDLVFPSFGVSFAHQRVYRSRTSYDGPLGHGWDFSYNQRLVAAPVEVGEGGSVALDPATGLPIADVGTETVSEEGGRHCGPVLLLTTGHASTLRFRERGLSTEMSCAPTT